MKSLYFLTSILASVLGFSLLAGCAAPKTHHPGLSSDGYGYVKNGPTLPPPNGLVTHMSPQEKEALTEAQEKGTAPQEMPSELVSVERTDPAQSLHPGKPHAAKPVTAKAAVHKVPAKIKKRVQTVKPHPTAANDILPDGAVLSTSPRSHKHDK
ncbi:hypothetical protein PT277_08680 [Acetobacteraceae bacterium ESL0709]|nr:hypothetical protein [Acetobacteraceae bacterium ESL0697]MDF7678758.1 hypothetical protein [Acetobacteraceae bacterium ESL0709]